MRHQIDGKSGNGTSHAAVKAVIKGLVGERDLYREAEQLMADGIEYCVRARRERERRRWYDTEAERQTKGNKC